MTEAYNKQSRINAMEALHRAFNGLKDHFGCIDISCTKTFPDGTTWTEQVEWSEDDDEDEDDMKVGG